MNKIVMTLKPAFDFLEALADFGKDILLIMIAVAIVMSAFKGADSLLEYIILGIVCFVISALSVVKAWLSHKQRKAYKRIDDLIQKAEDARK